MLFIFRLAEQRIRQKMKENQDTQTFYYEPQSTRYQKFARDCKEETDERVGTSL